VRYQLRHRGLNQTWFAYKFTDCFAVNYLISWRTLGSPTSTAGVLGEPKG
jgi:hypothetical protein